MDFKQYFQLLWFSKKETDIFLALYQLWNKPASTIAKYVNLERTYVYKVLLQMVDEWIVLTTEKKWVKHFFIPDLSLLKNYVSSKKEKIEKLENNYDLIANELLQYNNNYSSIPKITLFDWIDWIKNLYNDIYDTTIKKWYLVIKFFATNTFSSQISINETIKDYYWGLFTKLHRHKIIIDTYLWNWDLILEQIYKTNSIQNLWDLPAWNSAINIFIIWEYVYIIIFKDVPFWIKIDSEDLANVMHFLFENLRIQN